ncbi:unnamed protein product [Closterium sp. NIES-65]|nr:unnamed protein product [Closterium sp. NIES-65]
MRERGRDAGDRRVRRAEVGGSEERSMGPGRLLSDVQQGDGGGNAEARGGEWDVMAPSPSCPAVVVRNHECSVLPRSYLPHFSIRCWLMGLHSSLCIAAYPHPVWHLWRWFADKAEYVSRPTPAAQHLPCNSHGSLNPWLQHTA